MALERYFQKFPNTQYSNTTVLDITKRVAMADIVVNNPYVFYPYDLLDYERPDQLSHRYYSDAYKSWMIYLANKITDPYYEWYLQESELQNLINSKYGSFEQAISKVKYYRNNWAESENISISTYDALPSSLKGYWEPLFINNRLNSYTRKKEDWTINTNKIYSYTVDNANGFIIDELCHVFFANGFTGNGQIMAVDTNTNVVILQHTVGTMDETVHPSSYIYGTESETNTSLVDASIVASNLLPEEEVYWTPVTYFMYETEKNEYNKSILLLDNTYSIQTSENLRVLMSNT